MSKTRPPFLFYTQVVYDDEDALTLAHSAEDSARDSFAAACREPPDLPGSRVLFVYLLDGDRRVVEEFAVGKPEEEAR